MPNDGEAREEEAVTESETRTDQDQPTPPGGDAASSDTADSAPDLDADDTLAQLQIEVDDLKDQLLRKSADFDNYRKRMQREREEFASYANRDLLLDIVPIIDDFERAIKSGEESQDFTAFHDGIVMIEKQFASMLERKWKLVRFDSVGDEFDPQRHEAMMTEPVPGHEHSVVLDDFQKGYMLNEKVLRPAKVKVSMPAPPAGESGADADETERRGKKSKRDEQ